MLYKAVVIGILLGIYVTTMVFLDDISDDLHAIRTSLELNVSK